MGIHVKISLISIFSLFQVFSYDFIMYTSASSTVIDSITY